ncbi:hypothetical protein ROLI_033110 [Roseobacter fucihabitans]|uniref:Alpha/beta hydrolase n=1 Tax=Roseobacter fucihabitans TaxID=1537242 RepID=A0ABZ2BZY7_9RHOB|nr:alpha/beta hydrolase [Roseobacter litoralis]MBC6966729.1 Alpha/beta hydrolase family protein [Roseobacter litoralis]
MSIQKTIDAPPLRARIKFLTPYGASKQLVVLLHSYRASAETLGSVSDLVRQAFPDADQYVPELALETDALTDPEVLAQHHCEGINKICGAHDYDSIFFVGHSIGGLLARRIYLNALNASEQGNGASHWVDKVERIILLAGMNRGWQAGHQLSLWNLIRWRIGAVLAVLHGLTNKSPLLIMSVRRGAPFITRLRVDWIDASHAAKRAGRTFPKVVQLLGSIDDMVAPSDNIDLVSGSDFYYLDVPYSGHANVVELDAREKVRTVEGAMVEVGALRRAVLTRALAAELRELKDASYIPSDEPVPEANEAITDVVFVIHGIRDVGHWTQKIARAILSKHKTAHGAILLEPETPSYGFFPMLPFLMPWKRRQKVEWFMDQFAQAKAKFPNAKFSYVGHSHGTYLLARALQDYEFVKFKNVLFAGSVVRSGFPWKTLIDDGRIENVFNYVATSDWVVAIFPKAIELTNLQDLGSAGHDGFKALKSEQYLGYAPTQSSGERLEQTFIRGSHSAALVEENWDAIAEFVVNGTPPDIPESIRASTQANWLAITAGFAPLVWIVIAAFLVLIGSGIWRLSESDIVSTILIGIYGLLLWKVVTRL